MRADVCVIIVTYNSEDEIEACLEAVFRERESVEQQVIVLDNQSQDHTATIVRERFPEVNLIVPEENLGFARGCNFAAGQAEADFILLLNPDTVVRDHAVDRIVAFARQNPSYGLYGGRTLKPDGSLEPSCCWGAPSLWSFAMFAFGLSTLFKRNRLFDPESLGGWQRDSVREVGVITGCFLLASREAWQRLEGFDTRYFMYGEDADLSMRAREAGYRPVICPTATLVHEVGASSETPTHKMMLLFKGKACLVRSHYQGLPRALALCFLKLGVALRALPSLLGKESKWGALWKRRSEWLAGYPS